MRRTRILSLIAMLLLIADSLSAGVVGGPQSRSGLLDPGKSVVYKFTFEHFQSAEIKLKFDIYADDPSVCNSLKMSMWVGKEWLFTGAGRYQMADETAYCIVEGGYGSAHKYAKDRREVTVEVINALTSGAEHFDLTTN